MGEPRTPLRIAMISYYLPSGSKIGVGYQAHEMANALVRRGHSVDMFSACPPVDGALYTHREVRMAGSLRTFRFAWALRNAGIDGYDVLHAHGDDYLLWRRRAKVHVRTMHGSSFEEARRVPGLWEKLRMLLLGFTEVLATIVADMTVAVSPSTRRWTPWVRRVIPNGVDTDRFRPDPAKRSPSPSVLFVGTWSNRKRGAALAEAFAADVLGAVPDATLEMVCRDAPSGLDPSIRLLGELSDEELIAAYQRAWVFCLPSSYEGFGIPYAEAMASGLPVVATDNVGARYVTDDGRAGMLVPLDGVGEALRRLLTDREERDALARRSIVRSEAFAMSRVIALYEQLYRRR